MRLLVTGASGFIGRRFLELAPANYEITALWRSRKDFPAFTASLGKRIIPAQADLSDRRSTTALARRIGSSFDAVLHLAANGDPVLSGADPCRDLLETQMTALVVFTTFTAEKLVHFSSGAVYEGLRGKVGPEKPCRPMLPYAVTHLAAESYAKWAESTGRFGAAAVIRFFGAFGPHEPERKIYTRLCRRFALEGGKEFELRGKGKNLIDAMFVDDTVNAIMRVLESKNCSGTWDLSSGKAITLKELVLRAAKAFTIARPRIVYVGEVAESHQFRSDPSKFKKKFGFTPKVKLEEGLRRHAEWLSGR